MDVAKLVASWSKDRSTQVGSVIVRDRIIISTGYNGFPRGINDDIDERHERPLKYTYTSHAEENAIFNAARIGAKVSGAEMYITLHPCVGCTKAIIQSEIKRLYISSSDNPRFLEEFKISDAMLEEVGVEIVKM